MNQTQQDQPKGNNYCFNFEKLKIQQKIEPSHRERSYNQVEALEIITDELYDMFEDGYDFRFTQHLDYRSMKKEDRRSSFKRKSWMKFECSNKKCPHLVEKNMPSRWTSYYGLVQYRFTIKALEKSYIQSFDYDIAYPFKVEFHFQIFRQKCKKCMKFSNGKIYQSQLLTISRMFCWIIAQMLDNPDQQSQRRKKAKQRLDENQYDSKTPLDEEKKHKSMNCEACLLNKCKHKQARTKNDDNE